MPLIFQRKFKPTPRSGDIRRRTKGIWRRFKQSPGLVDPKDRDAFKDFLRRDIDFLTVLMGDIDEEFQYRWANPELPGVTQPSFGQISLFIQLGTCIRVTELEEEGIPREAGASGNWVVAMRERQTILTESELDKIGDNREDKICFICASDFEQEG
jgi:hypothetical protein